MSRRELERQVTRIVGVLMNPHMMKAHGVVIPRAWAVDAARQVVTVWGLEKEEEALRNRASAPDWDTTLISKGEGR